VHARQVRFPIIAVLKLSSPNYANQMNSFGLLYHYNYRFELHVTSSSVPSYFQMSNVIKGLQIQGHVKAGM
jgi:hypothetical protein